MPSDLALNCRNLCREYYDLMDNRSAYVNKLQGELRMAFPSVSWYILQDYSQYISYIIGNLYISICLY